MTDSRESRKEDESQDGADELVQMMLNLNAKKPDETVEKVLASPDLNSIVDYILSGKCKNIITMAGAGISTSAGIPDFRSPGTGLYDNLAQYKLPHPMAIFEINFFMENPEPFFVLAKNLYPGTFKPTVCHCFLRLLQDKGLLLRHYTQNIDTLERVAGIKDKKLVEAHGTFHTSHCLECHKVYTQEWIKEKIFSDVIPKCIKEGCDGIVKPDIVFFGESLPKRFFDCVSKDFSNCDLLIILGTSLVVQPFASLSSKVPDKTPRLYINLEASTVNDPMASLFGFGSSFKFGDEDNYRDVFWQGTCDDGCQLLAEKLGWKKELETLVAGGDVATGNSKQQPDKAAKI